MKRRILLVDDEMDYTFITKLTLEATGRFQVRALNLAAQVLPVARDFKPDLVLLDCMMPGMDGGQVAATLQADPQLRDTPFAFLTATVTEPETSTSRCFEGTQIFLPKTMPLNDLVEFIDRTLEAHAGPRLRS